METNYNAITAWATVITVFIAAIAIWLESRRTAISRGVDILMRYSSEFSSDEFLARRLRFAKILKKKMEGKLNKKDQNELVALATFFLDHYEVIGFLLRKKILDRQLVYVYYSYTLVGYWRFLKEVIDTYKTDEPTLWEDVEWLHDEFIKLYKKRMPTGVIELTDVKIKNFIETELS